MEISRKPEWSKEVAATPIETGSGAFSRTVLAVVVSYKTSDLVKNLLVSLDKERKTEAARSFLLRVVVVDNDSGDAAPVRRAVNDAGYQDWVTVITAPRNGGFAYGNNLGFRHGFDTVPVPDYFLLLNPDTEVRSGAISALVGFLDQHPDAGIVGSCLEYPDGRPWPFAFRFPSLLSELDNGLRLGVVSRLLHKHIVLRPMGNVPAQVDWFSGASMMLRRQVIEEVGGMDENYFLYFEETDFCRKIGAAGWARYYVPASRVMHIIGQSTGLTGAKEGPKRLPAYWFESRRRYFAKNHGLLYAIATDAVFFLAHLVGEVKEKIKGHGNPGIPYLASDFLHYSVLRRSNWTLASPQEWKPIRLQSSQRQSHVL